NAKRTAIARLAEFTSRTRVEPAHLPTVNATMTKQRFGPVPREAATFVLSVESGYFEGQLVVAVECIRRFAGSLAQAPVLVVTPRYGPSLTRTTLWRLQDLGARYLYRDLHSPWDWYPYMNKGLAAQLAEDLVGTPQVIWLDSDVLVVSDPTALLLAAEEDFACCAVDKNVGSTGPQDPNDAYWEALARNFHVHLDQLPWVQTEVDNIRVRM